MIEGLPAWRAHVLARLRRHAAATGDDKLHRLLGDAPPGP